MNRILAGAACAAFAISPVLAGAETCTNETWNRVMERGELVVGVKADYKPWGFRGEDGSIIGMEADMAQNVADTLGVDLELIPVVASNRLQFLEQGKIDLVIATMTDTADRREIVGIVGPNYYSSGTNVMVPKALGLTAWSELKDRPVCGVQGAFYNPIVEERYGATIVAFQGTAEARQALRDKKCVGFLYDDSSILSTLSDAGWDAFEMPMPTEDVLPWALAVPKEEQNCVFGRFMSGMQYAWHQQGTLIALEEKWGIQTSNYLVEMNEKLKDPMDE